MGVNFQSRGGKRGVKRKKKSRKYKRKERKRIIDNFFFFKQKTAYEI
ncbi:hypothetical protein JGI20_01661 [Candidatus Kryptobacter tengchongensis]|nr:hypothetical protein JGI20_01661 [Candidatus Kryptobacter tengchongensis]